MRTDRGYQQDESDGDGLHTDNRWRPVIERKLQQALSNSFLGFKKWLLELKSEAVERAQNAHVEKASDLRRAIRVLGKLANLERDNWDDVMATELMARCINGSVKAGRKRARRCWGGRVWGSVKLKGARACMNPVCNQRSRNGCSCDDCKRGGEAGTLMCKRCFHDEDSHIQAAMAQSTGGIGRRTRKPMVWLS